MNQISHPFRWNLLEEFEFRPIPAEYKRTFGSPASNCEKLRSINCKSLNTIRALNSG